ncbi:hypothetical protein ENBRE01_2779 [Enteropsectra breve]|nr:hypothetical protein ENBRE01_2779 [Enteropsectra breve]
MNARDDFDLDCDDDEFIKRYTAKQMKQVFGVISFEDEEELITLTEKIPIIISFYKSNFRKCIFMNKALEAIAPDFKKIKFATIDVSKCPKMVESLDIQVLPYLGFFRDGYFVDKLVGFEKLGNTQCFELKKLREYISNSPITKGIEN